MSRIGLIILALSACSSVYAVAGEPEQFQGRLEIVTFDNIDKTTEKFSSGVGYNGAVEMALFVKGNKVLVADKSHHYNTLLDPDKNEVTIWCEGLGKGMSCDYGEYLVAFSALSNKPRSIMGHPLPVYTVYDIKVITDTLKAFGRDARFVKGRLENIYAGTDVDAEIIPSVRMPEALNLTLVYGLDVEGLAVKFRFAQDNRGAYVGQLKAYRGVEVKSMDMFDVEDRVFDIPSGVKIKKGKVHNIDGFLKDVSKYLKKENLFPGQGTPEVIYELNEDDWSY